MDITFTEKRGYEQEVIKYSHHYKKLSENIKTDGYELERKLNAYKEKNPLRINISKPIKANSVRVICHVHHIDRNPQNNLDSNLITLCFFCHQDTHKDYL